MRHEYRQKQALKGAKESAKEWGGEPHGIQKQGAGMMGTDDGVGFLSICLSFFLILSLSTGVAKPSYHRFVRSIVVFGDSISDSGEVTSF